MFWRSFIVTLKSAYSLNNDSDCVCVFGLAAPCKAIFMAVTLGSCIRILLGAPTVYSFLSVVCDNLDRWRPCESADPLSKDFYPMAVNKIQVKGKQEELGRIGLW